MAEQPPSHSNASGEKPGGQPVGGGHTPSGQPGGAAPHTEHLASGTPAYGAYGPQGAPVPPPPPGSATQPEEIRISDLIVTVKDYIFYILRRWWVIILCSILGAIAGFFYAMFQEEDYITEATYIIDSDANNASFLSSLMNLAGAFGMGGSSSSEGFTNELLHGIIQSRRTIKTAMLQRYSVDGQYDRLGHHLIRMYPDWAEEWNIQGETILSDTLVQATAHEDSLLELMYLKVRADHLKVAYEESSALNSLTFRSLSRDFSIHSANTILNTASDFFISSAVSKERQSLEIAQRQADSLMGVLKAKEALLARMTDEQGYGFRASDLLQEGRLLRDIEVMSTMYAESYGSMEVARTNLRDKKPIIEMVDRPEYATHKEEIKLVAFSIIMGILGAFLCVFFFIVRKLITDILADEEQEGVVA